MERGITPAQLLEISQKMKNASNDNTPFAVMKEDKLSVIGDASKTEAKTNNYEIKFRMPKDMFESKPDGAQEVGSFYIFSINYESVSITPRKDLKIVVAIMEIIPFFNKLKEDGGVEELAPEELFIMFAKEEDSIHLAMYNIVATFLGIDNVFGEYMLPFSVISALSKLIDTHPEVFNEADVFFG